MSVLIGANPQCFEGTPFYQDTCETTDPGNTKIIFSFSVPVGTTRKLKNLWVSTTSDGDFELKAGGSVIAAGRNTPSDQNVFFKFDPPRPISAGTSVVLEFAADPEPSAACPIKAFLSGSDFT